nr:hypothetical protein [uncultured Methanoregula sp.]
MKKIKQNNLPPDQRDWLDHPKNKPIDGSTIAFVLGILVLICIIFLAIITPVLINHAITLIAGIDLPPKYQINNVTYDTKDQVIDFFKNRF